MSISIPKPCIAAVLAAALAAGTMETIAMPNAAAATAGPIPPCAAPAPYPAYPDAAASPNVMLWQNSDLPPGWMPAECLSKAKPYKKTTIAVALAGRIEEPSGVDAFLARMGAISHLKTVRYWSVTEKQWNLLFPRAYALKKADAKSQQPDFAPEDFQPGREMYFLTSDNRSGADMIERLQIRERDDNRLAMDTENVTPMRALFVTVAAPGDIQTFYDLRRGSNGAWLFYSLTRISNVPPLLTYAVHGESYVNRAVAMFRYLSGVPTDRDPPAAR
jgi:hypothetical protein